MNGLVEQIAGYVTANGFSGVDIDYEDDDGFAGGPDGTGVYDGVAFLIELTNGLAQELPPVLQQPPVQLAGQQQGFLV